MSILLLLSFLHSISDQMSFQIVWNLSEKRRILGKSASGGQNRMTLSIDISVYISLNINMPGMARVVVAFLQLKPNRLNVPIDCLNILAEDGKL